MQIESLLNFVNTQTAEAPSSVPADAHEFADLLSNANGSPPGGPPLITVPLDPSVIQGANSEMPNATEKSPDLQTTEPGTKEKSKDSQTEVSPDVHAIALLAGMQFPAINLTPEALNANAQIEIPASELAEGVPAKNAAVLPIADFKGLTFEPAVEGRADILAAVLNNDTDPAAPVTEFSLAPGTPGANEAKTEVDPNLTRVNTGTQIMSTEQAATLNPVRIVATQEPAPQGPAINPFTGEILKPAEVKIDLGKVITSPLPKSTTPVEAINPTKTSPQASVNSAKETKAKTMFAFDDRLLDAKTAFSRGLDMTIRRIEGQPTQGQTSKTESTTKPVMTLESLLQTRAEVKPILEAPAVPVIKEQIPTSEMTFQLAGTEPIKDEIPTDDLKTKSETDVAVDSLAAKVNLQVSEKAVVSTRVEMAQAKLDADTQLKNEQIVKQVVERADHFLAMKRDGAITIHLEPRELGSITLTIQNTNDGIKAEIKASNHQVQQSLEANKASLVQQVETKGLTLGSLNVTLSDSAMGGQTNPEQTQQEMNRQAQMTRAFANSDVLPAANIATGSAQDVGLNYVI